MKNNIYIVDILIIIIYDYNNNNVIGTVLSVGDYNKLILHQFILHKMAHTMDNP